MRRTLGNASEYHLRAHQLYPQIASGSGIQVLPADAKDFEEAELHACELVLAGDPRIGKVPGARRASRSGTKQAPRSPKRVKSPNTAGTRVHETRR
jgi:hypothetical protein